MRGECDPPLLLSSVVCQDSVQGTESGDFCEEFLFFTSALDRIRRKTTVFQHFNISSHNHSLTEKAGDIRIEDNEIVQ